MSVIISVLLHGGIIAWAITGLASTKEFKVEPVKSVPVDILTTSEFTKIKAGKKDAKKKTAAVKPEKKPEKKQDTKKKKKRKFARAVQSSKPPEQKTVPIRKDKNNKKTPAKIKEKPKNNKVVRSTSNDKNKRRTPIKNNKKPKTLEDIVNHALADNTPDAGSKSEPRAKSEKKTKTADLGKGYHSGQDNKMSISDIEKFRRDIEGCWNPPPGGLGAENMIVVVKFGLNKDGTISDAPRVMNRINSPFFQAAADSTVRAIYQCQPYELPLKKYDDWKNNTLTFNPIEMYGG